MDEDRFWTLIGELRGEVDATARHRLWLALRRLDGPDVLDFEERLAEVLHRLDHRSIARQRWRRADEPLLARLLPLSADGFLYARCAAVARGRETVEAIVADHRAFRGVWPDGEELLHVAVEAYEAVTKRAYPDGRVTEFSWETGSNPAGGWVRRGRPPGNPR